MRKAAGRIPACQNRRTTFSIHGKDTAIQGCCRPKKPRGQPVGGQGGSGMRTSRIACLAVASCLTMQGCGGTAFTLPPVSTQEALLAAHEVDIVSSLPQFPRTRAYYLEAIS